MTEIIEHKKLSEPLERFVLHWGDMGASWGVNRSVAQIHALLLIAERPLNAEEIADRLGLARSNVSNSLKELTGWSLIAKTPIRGDRRDHYEAVGDVWEMVRRIVDMRKARELDPAKKVLTDCLDAARADRHASATAVERLGDLKDMIDLFDGWYAQVKDTPAETLKPMIRLGSKAIEVLKPFIGKRRAEKKGDR